MVELSANGGKSHRSLGMEVTVNERGRLIVTKLLPGPISAAGVKVGDELVTVGEDHRTINQPFSNLSDLLHDEGEMPTKFGFLRPGLRDVIDVDIGSDSQTPLLNQGNNGKVNNSNWGKDICTLLMKSTAPKSQRSLPAPDWTLWDGPEDEPVNLLEQGVGCQQVNDSKPLLHPVTYAGETAVLRTLISGRLQATLMCLGASCLICLLLFLVFEDHADLHL
jgi:hypothetical protein